MSKLMARVRAFGHELSKAPAHSKLGLGMSTAGLGLSVTNYLNNRQMSQVNIDKANVEKQVLSTNQKSLESLRQIHKALQNKLT